MKYIDLTHTLSSTIPSWDGDCCFTAPIVHDYKDSVEPNLFRIHQIEAKAGCGTHMDAPAHCIPGGKTIDILDLDALLVDCIVIDISKAAHENYVADVGSIETFEREHGKIPAGSFVIYYSGWDKYWNDKEKYRNNLNFPSISEDVAQLLVERDVSGVGIDTLSPDAVGDDFPVHRVLLGAGKYIVENVANAGMLPATGAKISVMPIKIKDGTEAPIRLVAQVQ